jgi:predicted O-methyltransferase YrrM
MQNNNLQLPPDFAAGTEKLIREADTVEGYLSPNEMRFLALLAAVPTAEGEVLEVGSFKGKSTIVLAKAAAHLDISVINAVDPMNAPSSTDPDLGGSESSYSDFAKNIEKHKVAGRVRLHRMLSTELASTWNAPLRLLWIDGDHTYAGTKADLVSFEPFLSDGAIVAVHDVLHEFEGGARVFLEDILGSQNFGAAGFCGSIAWSRYHADTSLTERYREHKQRLSRKLSRLLPYLVPERKLAGLRKKMYKINRAFVPHGPVDPERWLNEMRMTDG